MTSRHPMRFVDLIMGVQVYVHSCEEKQCEVMSWRLEQTPNSKSGL